MKKQGYLYTPESIENQNLHALLVKRMQKTREIIFTHLWIAFLVFQAGFSARGALIFFLSTPSPLSVLQLAAINYLAVCLFLLILHNNKVLLGHLDKGTKLRQYLISLGATAGALDLYFLFGLLHQNILPGEWFLELWVYGTLFISYFAYFIVSPFLGRIFVKRNYKYALLLLSLEAEAIIRNLKDKKLNDSQARKMIISQNYRFWFYFDLLILAFNKSLEETYEIFLAPAGQFFNIQYKTRRAFNRSALLNDWKEFLVTLGAQTRLPISSYSQTESPPLLKETVYSRLDNLVIVLFDGNPLFANQIEQLFPFLRSLWNASFMPIKSIPVGKINRASFNLKESLVNHVRRSNSYDITVGGNKVLAFFFYLIVFSISVWLNFLIQYPVLKTNASEFQTELFRLFIFFGGIYLFTNSGLRILQRRLRSGGVNYIVPPRFYAGRRYFYQVTVILSLFLLIPQFTIVIQQLIIPYSSVLFLIVELSSFYLLLRFLQTPRGLVADYSDSLLVRELLRLLVYIRSSNKTEFRIKAIQSLNYCKRLFHVFVRRQDVLNFVHSHDVKIFVDSVKKYFDQTAYAISLGSKQVRLNAAHDLAVFVRSIATGDLYTVQEQIQDIDIFVKAGKTIPQRSILSWIIHIIDTYWLARIVLSALLLFLINQFVDPSIWTFLGNWSTVLQFLSK